MPHSRELKTSTTLLIRLKCEPADQSAWQDFFVRYRPLVERWCVRWGLQPADTDDVIQDLLVELSRRLPSFEYRPGGSFRGWLYTLAYRTWCQYRRKQRRAARALDVPPHGSIAADPFIEEIEEQHDRELLAEAMRRVQARVRPRTWQAFERTAVLGLSGAETATSLGMSIPAVYVARSKIQKGIRREIELLVAR